MKSLSKLSVSNERILSSLSEIMTDLLAVCDVNGTVHAANVQCRKFFGQKFRRRRMSLRLNGGPMPRFERIINAADRKSFRDSFRRCVNGGKEQSLRCRTPSTNDGEMIFDIRLVRIGGASGDKRHILVLARDVTSAVDAEKQIRLLATTVSCTRDAFVMTDQKGKFLFLSPSTKNMYGYSEKELIGKNIRLLRSRSTTKNLQLEIAQATLNGGWSGEIIERRKDGSEFPVELWTSPMYDIDRKPLATIWVTRDISARKQAERKLRSIAERLQLMLDNIDLLVFELDADGRFLLSRGKALEKLGLKPDEVVGVSALELYKAFPEVVDLLSATYKGQQVAKDVEVGGYIWGVNSIPLRDRRGKIIRVFGTAVDVSERYRAEETLRRESKLLRTLMDNIPDTIYFKDLNSRFTRINKAQAKVLNVNNPDDAIGKTDADFFPREHADRALRDEQDVMQYGKPLLGKVEHIIYPDGSVQWFSTTKVPMRDEEGRISGMVGSSRDITDLKYAEELEDALYRIAEETSSATDLKKVFSTIHGIISELMYAKNFFIALYDKKNDILSFPYFVDEVDVPPEPGTAGKGLTAYILRTGRSLLCNQEVSDELESRGEAELVGVPCPIWLGVPLIIEGESIGAMVVQHYSDPNAYGEREKNILEFVSTQVAKAIQRKRTEEIIKESEDRYRAFVEQSSEGIWRYECQVPIPVTLQEDEQVKLLFESTHLAECNDAMAHMYGYSSSLDLIGTRLMDLLPVEDPHNSEFLKQFIRSGYRIKDAESHEVDRGGDVRIIMNNLLGLIENGALIRIWGIQRDITERRHSENLLLHSEEKYRTLFEESQDCIILSEPDGSLLDINPAGVKLFGYSDKDELLRKNAASDLYFNPTDRNKFRDSIDTDGLIKDLEVTVIRKDGQKRVVLESSSVIRDPMNQIVGYRSFLRDITERKKLEEQLRQAQKMESIGTLAGGVAHDFNNILGIILGYASLLATPDLDEAKAKQSIETIKRAGQRGADLVRQLLTFARKGDPSFSSVNLNETVSELMKMLKQTFPRTVAIVGELSDNLPSVVADPSQLHQALLNLCVNSRDSMVGDEPSSPGGGTLTISTGFLKYKDVIARFIDAKPNDYVFIEVGDTGVGMDEATLGRMFEPFFTTKEIGKGTGLGLAVVYGVVNSHDALVDVQSKKGVGTRFTLYFPVPQQMQAVEKREEIVVSGIKSGSETILLVEDEDMLALLLKQILEDNGYTVIIAKDGEEGLSIYKNRSQEIHLILSDMGLPLLGGYEMFMKMKEINPRVKAIMASGYFNPNLKMDLINAGAKDFIQKPYVADNVIARVREVLDEG